MLRKPIIEVLVGCFMLAGLAALIMLAFKVSGLTSLSAHKTYVVTADFDNIGDLKIRAPVTLAGVIIGQVNKVTLDPQTFRAHVTMLIKKKNDNIPTDSTVSIFTQGLLGSNYVSITPGFDDTYLKNGDKIQTTHSALILENLIGQFLFSFKNGNDKASSTSGNKTSQ